MIINMYSKQPRQRRETKGKGTTRRQKEQGQVETNREWKREKRENQGEP